MEELKIVYLPLDKLTPYENNARKHEKADLQTIENSINQFGMCDPIGIWSDKNIIVEGHGRLLALKELGYTEAPCIRLDHLTDEQRKAYAIAHNKTAEMSELDMAKLEQELQEITNIDMSAFGFTDEQEEKAEKDTTYTDKVQIPQYEITGEKVTLADCLKEEKANELAEEIQQANITPQEREFLMKAACRHYAFNYKNIAEYYAGASKEMQHLMEKSALVIIDFDDAIANGYVRLKTDIDAMWEIEGDATENE